MLGFATNGKPVERFRVLADSPQGFRVEFDPESLSLYVVRDGVPLYVSPDFQRALLALGFAPGLPGLLDALSDDSRGWWSKLRADQASSLAVLALEHYRDDCGPLSSGRVGDSAAFAELDAIE